MEIFYASQNAHIIEWNKSNNVGVETNIMAMKCSRMASLNPPNKPQSSSSLERPTTSQKQQNRFPSLNPLDQ